MSVQWPPVVGVCGWKGAGKTTLIEALLPRLIERGLRVGVVKHDAHDLDVDRPGKDTDRYFRAGADVAGHDATQRFIRRHLGEAVDLDGLVWRLGETLDLVLVEGHKESPVPKLWLYGEGEAIVAHPPSGVIDAPPGAGAPHPEGVAHVVAALPRGEGLVERALTAVLEQVRTFHQRLAVYAGVLVGGASTRMGRPKTLLPWHGRTLVEHTVEILRPWVDRVILLGTGPIPEGVSGMPHLADAVEAEGPMAGVLALMRWAPRVRWLIVPCDLPYLSNEAVQWLLEQARPGRHAVMPLLPHQTVPEPLGALYDPPARAWLERAAAGRVFSLRGAFPAETVAAPEVPAGLAAAWHNVNTPDDWHRLTEDGG